MPDILTRIAEQDRAEQLTSSESANRKLRSVAKSAKVVRIITAAEMRAIKAAPGWQNGYIMVGRAQVVVNPREGGGYVARRL